MTDQTARDMLRDLARILKSDHYDQETLKLCEALEAGAAALGAFVNISKQLDTVGRI